MKNVLFAIFLFAFSHIAAQEVIDKIIAVVDDEVILQSELDFQVAMYASQRKLNPKDEKLRMELLNKLIEDKLLYAQAILDSIEVSDDDVNRQLDQVIGYYTQQYGSKERLEQAYGMSTEKIRREMRDDTRKNLMAEMLKNQKFGKVDITRREVHDFFEQYKDSLGMIAEKFEIGQILLQKLPIPFTAHFVSHQIDLCQPDFGSQFTDMAGRIDTASSGFDHDNELVHGRGGSPPEVFDTGFHVHDYDFIAHHHNVTHKCL